MSNSIVTVYTAGPGCMACRRTKRHLDKRGIDYAEYELDAFATEAAKYLGMTTAPIVCVSTDQGEMYWDGYRPDSIDALIAPRCDGCGHGLHAGICGTVLDSGRQACGCRVAHKGLG